MRYTVVSLVTAIVCIAGAGSAARRVLHYEGALTYHLAFTEYDTTHLQAVTGNSRQVNYRVRVQVAGTYSTAFVARKNHCSLYAVQLGIESARFQINGRQLATTSRIAAQMQQKFLILLSDDGRLRGMWLAPMSPFASDYVRRILGTMEVVHPVTGNPPKRWDTAEADVLGRYRANYQCLRGGEHTGTIVKTRLTYNATAERVSRGTDAQKPIPTPSGKLTAHVNLQNWQIGSILASYMDKERLHGKVVSTSRYQLTIVLQASKPVSLAAARQNDMLAKRLRRTPVVTLLQNTTESAEQNLEQNALGDSSLQTLAVSLADLTGETPRQVPPSQDSLLFRKFKALLYLHPQQAAGVGMLMRRSSPGSAALQILADACSANGTAQAQSALQSAVQQHIHSVTALSVLLPSLGMVHRPDHETIKLMSKLAFHGQQPESRQTAQLMLAVIAHTLHAVDPKECTNLFRQLDKRYLYPASLQGKEQFLLVLGNTGLPEALYHIYPFLFSRQAVLRSTALFALRRIRTKEADDLLNRYLAHDPSPEVRYEAASVIGNRTENMATFQLLCARLHVDPSSSVRKQILADLYYSQKAFPVAKSAITWAANHDSLLAVRQYARSLLGAKS